jgi:triphosphoribosyl-dephospho-CoA synthase
MKTFETVPWSTRTQLETAVGAAARLACLLEVNAPKPGNVSPGRHFHDTTYQDFVASASAIMAPLAAAGRNPLGATIKSAIEATRQTIASNTNLGIVLLFAPIARTVLAYHADAPIRMSHASLRNSLRLVLEGTTIDDARDAYAAIRRAAPRGMGQVEEQDVSAEPTVSLLATMQLAADRDGIAHEYVTTFSRTFEIGVPALERAIGDSLPWNDAVVETFLTLLAAAPDSHIARRGGAEIAANVCYRAREVLAVGAVRTERGRAAVHELDDYLRDAKHLGNPGTTADITAVAIFVKLLLSGSPRLYSQ